LTSNKNIDQAGSDCDEIMRLLRIAVRNCLYLSVAVAVPLLTGCKSESPVIHVAPVSVDDTNHLRFDPLQVGDGIRIDFSGAPTVLPSVQTDIKGDDTIRLDLIGDVVAGGKTPGELERAIQLRYVPEYYTHLNVTVTPVVRFFYVQGEVNVGSGGGRIPYNGQITVTRAIAAGGDFNPFADRRRVRLYRVDGTIKVIDCIKALDDPKLDLPVYPGDKIVVKRRLW
jgi:polysaccharide export outer membrane protein